MRVGKGTRHDSDDITKPKRKSCFTEGELTSLMYPIRGYAHCTRYTDRDMHGIGTTGSRDRKKVRQPRRYESVRKTLISVKRHRKQSAGAEMQVRNKQVETGNVIDDRGRAPGTCRAALCRAAEFC